MGVLCTSKRVISTGIEVCYVVALAATAVMSQTALTTAALARDVSVFPPKNSHQPGTNNSLESTAPSIAALYRYVYWAEEGVAKSTVSNARNVAPLAAPGSAVDQRKVAPAASPNSVAKCEQFSLSEGFDLFKAICDLVHRRYKAWSVVVVYVY